MTEQKGYILDPAIVGLKIRKIRKQKNLTLSKVAAALKYATGKLSKIENGKRSKIRIEEIESIAKVLGVPVNSLFDDDPYTKSEAYDNYLDQISQLEFKIELGLNSTLEKKIKHLGNQLEESCLMSHLTVPYYFMSGRYYMSTHHIEKAYHYFNLVIDSKQSSTGSSEINADKIIKAYNYLSVIEYTNNSLQESASYLKKAIYRYQENKEYDKYLIILYYNAGILYTRLGDYGVSRYFINMCIESPAINREFLYECLLLESVNYYLDNQIEQAKDQIKKILIHFSSYSSINIFELWIIILLIDPQMIKVSSSELLEIIQTEVTTDQLEIKLKCLHKWIKHAIKKSDYIHAYQIITECKKYDRMELKPLLKAYTYYLEAEVHQKTKQSKNKSINVLQHALSFLDDTDIEYWLIQYQIGQLANDEWSNHPGSKKFYYKIKELDFFCEPIKLLPNFKS